MEMDKVLLVLEVIVAIVLAAGIVVLFTHY
jgi:predicted lysophospholipase L1 biosynthesis ABC-type transport system permease subunit